MCRQRVGEDDDEERPRRNCRHSFPAAVIENHYDFGGFSAANYNHSEELHREQSNKSLRCAVLASAVFQLRIAYASLSGESCVRYMNHNAKKEYILVLCFGIRIDRK